MVATSKTGESRFREGDHQAAGARRGCPAETDVRATQMHPPPRVLPVGHVDSALRGRVEPVVLDVPHDADDGRETVAARWLDPRPDRRAARRQAAREDLVDDGDERRVVAVGLLKPAASLQRNPQGREVAGADDVAVPPRPVGGAGEGPALDLDGDAVPVARERQRARDGSRLDSGQSRRALGEPVEEEGLPRFRVALLRDVDGERPDIVRPDARLDALDAHETLREEAGEREERQRQRELHDGETVADADAPAGAAGPAALFQGRVQVLGRDAEGWQEPGEKRGRDARSQREEEETGVGVNTGSSAPTRARERGAAACPRAPAEGRRRRRPRRGPCSPSGVAGRGASAWPRGRRGSRTRVSWRHLGRRGGSPGWRTRSGAATWRRP